jgi:hypothetical protein
MFSVSKTEIKNAEKQTEPKKHLFDFRTIHKPFSLVTNGSNVEPQSTVLHKFNFRTSVPVKQLNTSN